jgi:hypothetical protein
MAFKPLKKQLHPVRRWAVKGPPGCGKSSFVTQAEGPILVLDIDRRFSDVRHLTTSDVLSISDQDADLADVRAIDRLIAENSRNSGIKSTVVDSVTPLFQRIIRRKALDEAAGEGERNKGAAHREKADTMALLTDAVCASAGAVYFIWHTGHSRLGTEVKETESLSKVEQERLRRHLNAEIEVISDPKDTRRRVVKVQYCRTNPSAEGKILWDSPENLAAGTFWKGMMDRLDILFTPAAATPAPKPAPLPSSTAAADAPTPETAPRGDAPVARTFASPDEAIAWGATELQLNVEEVAAVYEETKKQVKPASAKQMWTAWVTTVEERKKLLAAKEF